MRKYLNLLFVSAGLVLFMASCACSGVDCENGGTCNDGKCDCLYGYYGDKCELKDFCELNEVVCVYGECTDGICNCAAGYEKEDCSVASRDKFMGSYSFKEECDALDTVTGYIMSIDTDNLNLTKMTLVNVFNYAQFPTYGFYSKVSATPTPNTSKFKIPNQEPDGNGKLISGEGSITKIDSATTRLHIDYKIKLANGKEYSCALNGTLIQ